MCELWRPISTILPGSAIVSDVDIAILPPAPLHALEIWGNPQTVAARFAAARGFALPALGQSGGDALSTLIRFEPTVWLVEGEIAGLEAILGEDGAITAIGGGIVRVRLGGSGWRKLLMEGGVFNAESASFAKGCSAATIIDHVNVRLHVTEADACMVYVPASYASDFIAFWEVSARSLV
jgi:heterotetrameric sarcosine oxidase gamma subunit